VAVNGAAGTVVVEMYAHHTTPHPTRRSRAFTITEVVVSLIVLGILATIAVPVFSTVRQNTEVHNDTMGLRGAVAAARDVAGRSDTYTYPADLVAVLAAMDARYISEAATSANSVSVHRAAADIAYFTTIGADGACVVVRDDITTDTQTYARDTSGSLCNAAAATAVAVTGTYLKPNVVVLDS
jgi:prepilin-type N-terminal cleavage/methylation domain-containing protein